MAVVLGAGGLVGLHALWECKYMVPAARTNHLEGVELANKLLALLGAPEEKLVKPGYSALVAHGWQVGVSALLALFLVVIVSG